MKPPIISNYDKKPFIDIAAAQGEAVKGWNACLARINQKIDELPAEKKIVVLETYQGVRDSELIAQLSTELDGTFFYTRDIFKNEQELQQLVYPDVTDDDIFGFITRLEMKDFIDPAKLAKTREAIDSSSSGTIFIYGPGAALIPAYYDLLVYFDMPRWEIQLRFRNNEVGNLGFNNNNLKTSLQYKQAFFVDWRVCDKHKKTLMQHWDLLADTTIAGEPKIVSGALYNKALKQATTQPFRLVPFFDPGPWGGQWIKEYCDMDRSAINYAWAFDCVPEENSLLFRFNDVIVETPSLNLVFTHPRTLLGDPVHARFGDEFPIRFDFLDTMDGGNLSLQVHPTTEYIREKFGMTYTQDESYYMLDTEEDAVVYLGLKDNINSEAMIDDLQKAQQTGEAFDAEKYVEKWPVKKHDHVLIPAGTIHCSGKNSMVLEISATPYIFTFKLYDWGRMGLDGKPRPINIEHGKKVINWGCTPEFTRRELVNAIEPVAEGDGWKEERTGLHKREFIETRRHWFTKTVHHHTNDSVNVLNLVEGREAIVESPTGAFAPFVVHYAETFVIPESVKEYTIRPYGESEGKTCGTIKAFVRTKP